MEYIVIDECTNASVFVHFVGHLIDVGMLTRGDIFIVDNYTVHIKGNNENLQNRLLEQLGILMIPLPP